MMQKKKERKKTPVQWLMVGLKEAVFETKKKVLVCKKAYLSFCEFPVAGMLGCWVTPASYAEEDLCRGLRVSECKCCHGPLDGIWYARESAMKFLLQYARSNRAVE